MSTQVTQWRINCAEGVLETDFETLKDWIVGGKVRPTDLVSKGNLKPIEARRVPALRSIFVNEEPVQIPPAADLATETHSEVVQSAPTFTPSSEEIVAVAQPARVCHYHPEVEARFACRVCTSEFCEQCAAPLPGTSNAACALCGNTCNPIHTETSGAVRREGLGVGFGSSDFFRALRYPFQHAFVLLFGAALYGLLQLAGLWGRLAAYVIIFGCITHVISQVAWGRIDKSFLPDFSEFSLWDDLAVPLGLGLGITIVSWGPTILLVLVLVFGFGGASRVGLTSGSAADSQAISREDLSTLANPEADSKKLEEANKKLDQLRPGRELSQEAEHTKQSDPMADGHSLLLLLGGSAVLVLLGLITVAWGIFYYPMALAVAGYTETFSAVVNPMVGLDTIRRMGATYFKAFGMVIGIQVIGLIVSVVVAMITSPFALPFVGNLPASVIGGAFSFYFNLVIACVLGLSLYKCSDRLGIEVD